MFKWHSTYLKGVHDIMGRDKKELISLESSVCDYNYSYVAIYYMYVYYPSLYYRLAEFKIRYDKVT